MSLWENESPRESRGDFKSLISICSFITRHHALFFEADRISSRLLIIVMFTREFVHSNLLSKNTKMRLILADQNKEMYQREPKFKLQKTSKLTNAIKHKLNIVHAMREMVLFFWVTSAYIQIKKSTKLIK